ncbi:MAG: hypothetical protein K2O24_07395 [Muribaculaceae bacterium]|nr:hypothetical protein [Muribaculaceae bacterium]
MITPYISHILRPLRLLTACLMLCVLTSCFTGVEGTKRIELSRADRRRARLSAEDTLLRAALSSRLLADLRPGDPFRITDSRLALFCDIESADPADTLLLGRTVRFDGLFSRLSPSGAMERVIGFSDGRWMLTYPLGRTPAAADSLPSARLPMMLDLTLVDRARHALKGRRVWTRTSLGYDSLGTRTHSPKFAPYTIDDVFPCDGVFPLRLALTPDSSGVAAGILSPDTRYAYLNFGNGIGESRTFASLFSLSDPRARHSDITDEIWRCIMAEKVTAGMTKQECRLALGNPGEIEAGHDYSRLLDIWIYPDGSFLRFIDGRLADYRQ